MWPDVLVMNHYRLFQKYSGGILIKVPDWQDQIWLIVSCKGTFILMDRLMIFLIYILVA